MGPFIFQLHEVTCLVFPQAPKQAGAMSSSVPIQEPDPKQHTTALDRFHRAHATWLLIKQPAAFTTWATIPEVTRDLFSTLPAIAIRRSQEPLSFRNPNKDFLSSQTLGGDSRTTREPQIPHLPVSLCDKATTRVSNLQSDKSHQDSRGDGWCTLAARGTAFCFLGELLCLTLADRVTLPPFPPEMSYLRLLRLATSCGSQGSWRGIWHQADSVHTLGRTTSSITAPQRWRHWDY